MRFAVIFVVLLALSLDSFSVLSRGQRSVSLVSRSSTELNGERNELTRTFPSHRAVRRSPSLSLPPSDRGGSLTLATRFFRGNPASTKAGQFERPLTRIERGS